MFVGDLFWTDSANGKAASETTTGTNGHLGLLETDNDFNSLLVFDDLGVTFGEVTSVFEERPIAAGYVYEGEDNLVGKIVDIDEDPAETFVLAAQVDFVEDDSVDQVLVKVSSVKVKLET